jgi:hypothetical protein
MTESAITDSWEDLLTAAFEILLDRPLTSYDPHAIYAAFFGGNFMDEMHYNRDPTWLDRDALEGGKAITISDLSLYYLNEPPLQFDASGSIFELDLDTLPDAAASRLATACFSGRGYGLITGRSLSAVLKDFPPDVLGDGWSVAYPRIASDGTLWDAMRVATGLGRTAASLIPFNQDACEHWRMRLATISHPGLRAHLAIGCAEPWDAEGLVYYGADSSGKALQEKEWCVLIANWEEGQSQREVAVAQLGAQVM